MMLPCLLIFWCVSYYFSNIPLTHSGRKTTVPLNWICFDFPTLGSCSSSTDIDRILDECYDKPCSPISEGISIWNPSLPWQPIPVHTVPVSEDQVSFLGKEISFVLEEGRQAIQTCGFGSLTLCGLCSLNFFLWA